MRTLTRISGPALLALVLAACAGGDDDPGGVASLGAGDATTTTDGGGGGGGRTGDDAAFQDAMVEFAECMREHGIDMQDPTVGEGGGFVIVAPAGGAAGTEADREDFEAADAACQHILEAVEDSRPQPSPEELAEMQDEALEFAECMREHGVDWPDPVFDDGGARTQIGPGDGASAQSGPDPGDPDVQDAMEECGEGGRGPVIRSEGRSDGAANSGSGGGEDE